MKTFPRSSLASQIALGFAGFALVLGFFSAAVLRWAHGSERAQSVFFERVEPRRAIADELERRLLEIAISVRAFVVVPSASRHETFERTTARMHAALRRLDALPIDSSDEHLRASIGPEVTRYVALAEAVVEATRTGEAEPAEASLPPVREVALARIGRFREVQEGRSTAALAALAEARERIVQGTILASLLALASLAALAAVLVLGVRRATKTLLATAGGFEAGDWAPALAYLPAHGEPKPRNELAQLARAFGIAAVSIEKREQHLVAEANVANAAVSSLDPGVVAHAVLEVVVAHLGVEVGVLYGHEREPQERLVALATHALAEPVAPLRVGEGLPGQAAKSRRTVVARDVPRETAFAVKLGYDAAPPRTVVAVPIVVRSVVHGVLLVASLRDLDADAVAFLERAAVQVGVALENVDAYRRIELLLGNLQERHEEIQAQNEELQAQNEEIQAQQEQLQAQNEEIQAQNEQLETQTGELRDQQSMLLEADTRKNEFLAVLAHELRNPLAAIVSGLFLLRTAPRDSDSFGRAIVVMERQLTHLRRLVDDLLDVSRISRGKVDIEREPLDLVELLRSCLVDHREATGPDARVLVATLPDGPLPVHGDRTRLAQVVGNLLTNAVKFSDEGGTIRVQLDRDGARAVLRVSDDGIGIHPDLLERLFEPFMQAETTLARTKGGLGLGLALVKNLVELHGGTVSATSAGLGKGAELEVRLPLAEMEPVAR